MTLQAQPDAAVPPAWFTEALAAPVTERVTSADGVQIAYRTWGARSDRGIVLVHGGGAHSRWWDHIAPLLTTDRMVIAIDLSGHGDSGRRPSYGFDAWAREVLAVAADAGLTEPPVVIGHSMGGIVTLRLASMSGSRIEGAVVVDSPLRDPAPEERAARRERTFRQLIVYPTREAIMARFRPVPDQPVLGYVAEHIAATSVREADGGWIWKWDPAVFSSRGVPAAPLSRLDCRAALFRAEHGILSAEMSDLVYDRLGRVAPVIEIPVAGHHVMLDQPIALVAALRTLLSDWDHSRPVEAREPRLLPQAPRAPRPGAATAEPRPPAPRYLVCSIKSARPTEGRAMITSDEAHRIATEVIGPASAGGGQGWHLEEFGAGWLVRQGWTSDKPVMGGSFCVVERAGGRVLAFPSSISPARIMTEYDRLVDRAARLSG